MPVGRCGEPDRLHDALAADGVFPVVVVPDVVGSLAVREGEVVAALDSNEQFGRTGRIGRPRIGDGGVAPRGVARARIDGEGVLLFRRRPRVARIGHDPRGPDLDRDAFDDANGRAADLEVRRLRIADELPSGRRIDRGVRDATRCGFGETEAVNSLGEGLAPGHRQAEGVEQHDGGKQKSWWP